MHKGRKARHEVTDLVDVNEVKKELHESALHLRNDVSALDVKLKKDVEILTKKVYERKSQLKLSFENVRRNLYKKEEELMVQLDAIGSYNMLRLQEKQADIRNKMTLTDNLITEVRSVSDNDIVEKASSLIEELYDKRRLIQTYANQRPPIMGLIPDLSYINHDIMTCNILNDEDWREGYQAMVCSCISVHCPCIDGQGRFWLYEIVSRPEVDGQIDLLAKTLTCAMSSYSKFPKLNIVEGLLCSAQSSVDRQWHRGYIEKVNVNSRDKGAVVLFLDYGSIEIVPHEHISMLPPIFADYPFRCHYCASSDVDGLAVDWKNNREAKWAYSDATRKQSLSVKVLRKFEFPNSVIPLFHVELLNDQGVDIMKMVIKTALSSKETFVMPQDIRYKNNKEGPVASHTLVPQVGNENKTEHENETDAVKNENETDAVKNETDAVKNTDAVKKDEANAVKTDAVDENENKNETDAVKNKDETDAVKNENEINNENVTVAVENEADVLQTETDAVKNENEAEESDTANEASTVGDASSTDGTKYEVEVRESGTSSDDTRPSEGTPLDTPSRATPIDDVRLSDTQEVPPDTQEVTHPSQDQPDTHRVTSPDKPHPPNSNHDAITTVGESESYVVPDSDTDVHTTASEIEHESDGNIDTRQQKRKKTLNRVTIDVSESDTATEVDEPPVRPSKLTLDLCDVIDDATGDAQDVAPPIHPSVLPDAQLSLAVNSSLTKDGIFWGQLLLDESEEQQYNNLSDKLQAHAATKGEYTPIFFTAGDLCMAVFTEDEAWYRGIVTKEHSKESLEVLFVDYGNSDVVDTHNIMALKTEFRSLPYHAIQCCLTSEDVEFTEQECALFDELLSTSNTISVTVLYIEDDIVYVNASTSDGKDLYCEVTGKKSSKLRSSSFDIETPDDKEGLTWAEQMDSLQSPSEMKRDNVFINSSEVTTAGSLPGHETQATPDKVYEKKGVTKSTPKSVSIITRPRNPSSSSRPSFNTSSVNKFLGIAVQEKPKDSEAKPTAKGKAFLEKAGRSGRRKKEDWTTFSDDWGGSHTSNPSKRKPKRDKSWGEQRPEKTQENTAHDTLYVRKFPFGTTSSQVMDLFKEYGPVLKIRQDRRCLTSFFVDMKPSDCEKAMHSLKSRQLPSHDGTTFKVRIEFAKRF